MIQFFLAFLYNLLMIVLQSLVYQFSLFQSLVYLVYLAYYNIVLLVFSLFSLLVFQFIIQFISLQFMFPLFYSFIILSLNLHFFEFILLVTSWRISFCYIRDFFFFVLPVFFSFCTMNMLHSSYAFSHCKYLGSSGTDILFALIQCGILTPFHCTQTVYFFLLVSI